MNDGNSVVIIVIGYLALCGVAMIICVALAFMTSARIYEIENDPQDDWDRPPHVEDSENREIIHEQKS